MRLINAITLALTACGGTNTVRSPSAPMHVQPSAKCEDNGIAAAPAIPRWCAQIEQKTETIRLPDNRDCIDGFKGLAVGSVDEKVKRELSNCSSDTPLGRYGLAVLVGRIEGPTTFRAQMLALLADPTFHSCRWCTTLAERDLAVSLINEAPADPVAGISRLRETCVNSLREPILLFFRGRDPCSLLPAGDSLSDIGRINSMMYIDLLRQCEITNFLSSLIDWSVVEIARQ